MQPSFGDAYWSLANLKTFRFDDDDIDAMRQQIDGKQGSQEDYFHMCFALGKALQDRGDYDDSFRYYELGNELKEKLEGYSADDTTDTVDRIMEHCTSQVVYK